MFKNLFRRLFGKAPAEPKFAEGDVVMFERHDGWDFEAKVLGYDDYREIIALEILASPVERGGVAFWKPGERITLRSNHKSYRTLVRIRRAGKDLPEHKEPVENPSERRKYNTGPL